MNNHSTLRDITNPTYTAGDIVKAIKNGKIAMPDFQRDFVWKPKNVLSLLASVANRWPIGAILASEQNQHHEVYNLPLKGFDGAPIPDENNVDFIIFDGQQRLTSLMHAFDPDTSDRVYFIRNMKDLLEQAFTGTQVLRISDDDFESLPKAKFHKDYPTIESRANHGLATIKDVFDSGNFAEWIVHLDDSALGGQKHKAEMIRKQILGDMTSYPIAMIKLDSNLGLEPLASIFETVNKTGIQLGIDDLMMAKLYPHKINLKDLWDKELESESSLREFADTWDDRSERGRKPLAALHVLRLIAFWEHGAIKKGDLLNLDPKFIHDHWKSAIDAIVEAINFIKSECGIVHHTLLPDDNMILPIADYFVNAQKREMSKLMKWYWRAIVDETYATNTSTQPVADANLLRSNVLSESFSGVEHGFNEATVSLKTNLMEQRRRHDVLSKGVAGLLIHEGAEDWIKSTSLRNATQDVELHHIFPTRYSINEGWKGNTQHNPVNIVANLTPLYSTTNKSIGSRPPKTAIGDLSISRQRLARHLVCGGALNVSSLSEFNDFARQRAESIADMLMARCR